MDDLQLIQDELDQARRYLHNVQNAASTAGWTNDEADALCTLARCADAADVSLENRFTERAYTYTPEHLGNAVGELAKERANLDDVELEGDASHSIDDLEYFVQQQSPQKNFAGSM